MSLSDKRNLDKEVPRCFYWEEDVKEFIKELIEEAIDGDCNADFIKEKAGKDLI